MSLLAINSIVSFSVSVFVFALALLFNNGALFRGNFAFLPDLGVILGMTGIIFLIGRILIKRKRPFCFVIPEDCFIIQECGSEARMVFSRKTKKHPKEKYIFSRKDMKLRYFNFGQFSEKDQFHVFPFEWSEKISDGEIYKIEVEVKFRAKNPGPEYFGRYGNGHMLRKKAKMIVAEAVKGVASTKIKEQNDDDDEVVVVRINEIKVLLREMIDKSVKRGDHPFEVAELLAMVKLAVPSSVSLILPSAKDKGVVPPADIKDSDPLIEKKEEPVVIKKK
jgi:hypothetical protein